MPRIATMLLLLAVTAIQGKDDKSPPKAAPKHAVVIHVENPIAERGEAARAIIRKLFLKELTHWPSGSEAKAYARSPDAPSQTTFRQTVLGMSEAELARHWLKQKSMSGATPPKEVETDRLVLKYVAKNPQAFGIVSLESVKDATGIKVLFEF